MKYPKNYRELVKHFSTKKKEFKDKSLNWQLLSRRSQGRRMRLSEHLEALSEKPVASVRQQISPTIKLLTSTSKSNGLALLLRKFENEVDCALYIGVVKIFPYFPFYY